MRAFSKRLENTGGKLIRFGDTMNGAVKRGFGAVTRGAKLAAASVTALSGALAAIVYNSAQSTEEVNRFARRLGVSTRFLSEMSFAGRQFGIETEAMVDGMKELSMRTEEFALTGKGPAAEALERIGIGQKEAASAAGDTARLFQVVRDRLSSVQNAASRQRLADELFGGSGGEQMIELLQLSRQEINTLRGEARQAGASVTEEQAAIAREFTQSFDRLKSIGGGLMRLFSVQIMPVVTDAFRGVADTLMENRDKVVEFGKRVAAAIKSAIPRIKEFVSGFGDADSILSDVMATVKVVAGVIKSAIETFVALPESVQKGVAAAVLFSGAIGPIAKILGGLLSGPIAGLVGALPGLAGGFTAVAGMALRFVPVIGAVLTGVALAVTIFKNWGAIVEIAKAAISGLIGAAKEFAGSVVDAIKGAVSGAVNSVKQFGTRVKEGFVAGFQSVKQALKDFGRGFIDFWRQLPGNIVEFVAQIPGKVMDALGNLGKRLKDWAMGAVRGVADAFKGLYNTLVGNSIVPDMRDDISAEFAGMTEDSTGHSRELAAGVSENFDGAAAASTDSAAARARGAGGAGGGSSYVDMRHAVIRDDRDLEDRLGRKGVRMLGGLA